LFSVRVQFGGSFSGFGSSFGSNFPNHEPNHEPNLENEHPELNTNPEPSTQKFER